MENKCLNILLDIERSFKLEYNIMTDCCCIKASCLILGLRYQRGNIRVI